MRQASPVRWLALVLLLATACTAPAPSPASPAGQPVPPTQAAPASGNITLAILREPTGFIDFNQGAKPGGANNAAQIVHQSLVVVDEAGRYVPQLAAELTSVDRGTWRINSDGSMDTTWKLRPNVKWHDGTPFTSADLLFAFTVKKDPDIAWSSLGRPDLMESATAPDPLTLVIHWSTPYFDADRGQDLVPLPQHLVGDLYASDKASLQFSPRFSTTFVGLGPYRLERWEAGAFMQFSRFDDYFQGTPPFNSVTLKFLGDPNTMVANVLSGAVDVLLPLGLDVEAAQELERRWAGTGNQVRYNIQDTLWYVQVQFRPDYARPTNGLTDRSVRAALYQATDRQALVDVATSRAAPIADSWFNPRDAIRPDVDSAIPQFPYDLARAQQLLRDAGWTRGADGTLVNGQTRDHFEIELRGNQAGGIEKRLNVVADGWKAVGADVQLNVVPTARASDAEYASTFPGGFVFFSQGRLFWQNRLHSSSIAAPANRWTGRNRGGYRNPRVDTLLDQIVVTIDPRLRVPLQRQLLQEQLGDVALMPLYWEVTPVVTVQGITGPIGGQDDVISNFFGWRRA
ncbi:MAG: peptide/nickel transport system substrate-binding protein [Chloroflexota bacterium]|nr:peptide/nickel transport system substrate-binding protein [Chloroflexota bacterium]